MHFIVIAANNSDGVLNPWGGSGWADCIDHNVQVFAILHENAMLVQPDVIVAMVQKWKASFHPSELPITEEMEDAPNAFLEWLEAQPFGYIIPKTHYNLHSFPIYDVVN